MKKFFNNIFLWSNVFFALVLAFCVLVPKLSPNVFWPIVFAGLGFLIWIIINIFYLVYYLISLNKWFLISAFAILINYGNIMAYFGTTSKAESNANNSNPIIKVATLNTQLFGYFDDSKKNKPDWELDVVTAINELNPDFLCLQEFLSLEEYDLNFYKRKLGFKHAYFKVLKDGRKHGQFGMVILSKYPITDSGSVEFSEYTGNMGAWIDAEVEGIKIRVMSVHLQSIRFSREDYKVIEKPKQDINMEESKTLLRRIKHAAGLRAKQVDRLMADIVESKLPIILCGDFNEPPVSYSYGQICPVLKDVYSQTSFGLETTYTGKFPAYRIDYIFHDKSWKAIEYKSRIVPSDHKLVFAKIEI